MTKLNMPKFNHKQILKKTKQHKLVKLPEPTVKILLML